MPAGAPLDVQPLSAPLGAEVRGVDLRDLDDDTWCALIAKELKEPMHYVQRILRENVHDRK